MKKIVIAFFAVLLTVSCVSQDILFEENIAVEYISKAKGESFPIINNGCLTLFVLDKSVIKIFEFDKKFNLIKADSTNKLKSKNFKNLLGYTLLNNQYNLVFTNKKENQFFVKTINPLNGESTEKLLPIKFKDEKFVQAINHKNKLYLLSIKKASSILKISLIEGVELTRSVELDMSGNEFSDDPFKNKLYNAFYTGFDHAFRPILKLTEIEQNTPIALKLSTDKSKIYVKDDSFLITVNNDNKETKLISIDINEFTYTIKRYAFKAITDNELLAVKSNSFLYNNFLFTLIGCKQSVDLNIINLKNDSVVKNYKINKDEDIDFKNSDIVLEWDHTIFSDATRTIDKTNQFLRKIAKSNMGVSVFKTNKPNEVEVTIGSYEFLKSSGGGMMMMSGGGSMSTPAGTINTAPTFHVTSGNFGSCSNTRVVYFKSLLNDYSFENCKGKVEDNVFDKIKTFTSQEGLINIIAFQTVFKYDDYFILGYYHTTENRYYLRKFIN